MNAIDCDKLNIQEVIDPNAKQERRLSLPSKTPTATITTHSIAKEISRHRFLSRQLTIERKYALIPFILYKFFFIVAFLNSGCYNKLL